MSLRAALLSLTLLLPCAAAAAAPAAKAVIHNAAGAEIGTATFTSAKDGLQVRVEVSGLPAGDHGIHLHAVGKCEGPDFKSSGMHFNPGAKKHGRHSKEGFHAGDLPNLKVGVNGKAAANFFATGVTLGEGATSLFGPSGSAIVIHADPDDEKSDPGGNSGGRIACGVIEKG